MATRTQFIAQFNKPMIIKEDDHFGVTICNPNCPHYVQTEYGSHIAPTCSLYEKVLAFAPMNYNDDILGIFSIPVAKCLKENFTET